MGVASFAHFYDDKLDDGRTAQDAAVLRDLLGPPPQRILDAGCGYGRISRALSGAGFDVVGVDHDAAVLDDARGRGAAAGAAAPGYVCADLHAYEPDGPFDAVVSWYSSFGFEDDERNLRLLERLARWVRPGGLLVLDLVSRDRLVRTYKEWISLSRGDDTLVDHNRFDPDAGVSHISRRMHIGGRLTTAEMQMRVYTASELRVMLAACGLVDVTVEGHDRQPVTIDTPRLLVTASRPG